MNFLIFSDIMVNFVYDGWTKCWDLKNNKNFILDRIAKHEITADAVFFTGATSVSNQKRIKYYRICKHTDYCRLRTQANQMNTSFELSHIYVHVSDPEIQTDQISLESMFIKRSNCHPCTKKQLMKLHIYNLKVVCQAN